MANDASHTFQVIEYTFLIRDDLNTAPIVRHGVIRSETPRYAIGGALGWAIWPTYRGSDISPLISFSMIRSQVR
jgi:hypothetical protein